MPARPDASTTRALAWLYSPATQRPLFAALCGIESEIGASLKSGLDHQVAHTRLAWWREECERCAQGRPVHPLTRELIAGVGAGGAVPLAALTGLVDAAVWDLAAATFETRRELTAYCERWAGAMIEPLAQFSAPAAEPAACRTIGAALREIELLCALAREARAGRFRLPLDELARANAEPEQLARPPWPAPLAARLRERHAELRMGLAAAVRALGPQAQAPLRGVMVWAALASSQSQRAAGRLPNAARERDHHALLDGWRAWRTARRADRGRLALKW